MKTMLDTVQKVLIATIIVIVLTGCREQAKYITVFNDLPSSKYMSLVEGAIQDKKPITISFTAEWCPHCRKYKPTFFEVEEEYKEKVAFINIDVEDTEGRLLTERFHVSGVPTTAFIRKDGSVMKIGHGNILKEDLIKDIKALIKSKKKKKGEPVAPFSIDVDTKENDVSKL